MATVVRVDDIIAVGRKGRCDKFCDDLKLLIPINHLGELTWYAGCNFVTDVEADALMISQQASAENTATKVGVCSGKTTPLPTDLKLNDVDELVACLMWLTKPTTPRVTTAVKAIAVYSNWPNAINWKAAIGRFGVPVFY